MLDGQTEGARTREGHPNARRRGAGRRRRREASARDNVEMPAPIELTADEVNLLVRIADFHLKAMGLMRYVVWLTASSEVRSKYRFVAEESRWLKRFAEAVREDMAEEGRDQANVAFTPRSLVAFWGRLLASLNSRRSRRRLSEAEVQRREELATKLETAVRTFGQHHPTLLEEELQTRRPAEGAWMRSRLGLE